MAIPPGRRTSPSYPETILKETAMGLDFSHTDASWSYSGFRRFREALATHEGIDLTVMNGFRGAGDDRTRTEWTDITTPLRPLLDHSDCDGVLTPDECRQVAPYLRSILPAVWPDPDSYDCVAGTALCDGMDSAAAADEPLEFC